MKQNKKFNIVASVVYFTLSVIMLFLNIYASIDIMLVKDSIVYPIILQILATLFVIYTVVYVVSILKRNEVPSKSMYIMLLSFVIYWLNIIYFWVYIDLIH
ncbi:MAG: hypothetical protein SO253_04705 [Bacilli bacterium]|nr:hypothetical protein [Bacilli bacterium]